LPITLPLTPCHPMPKARSQHNVQDLPVSHTDP
jgi:hypothetical protein